MGGIFAYVNFNVNRERSFILNVLFTGLRRLENRGYDSAGIAIDSSAIARRTSATQFPDSNFNSSSPLVFRQEGKIDSLFKAVFQELDGIGLNLNESFPNHAGIAHLRWATHGEPTQKNCHPLSSGAANEFIVIHNGLITNHEVLKEYLMARGVDFTSETDTEVIPKLAKFVHDKAKKTEAPGDTVTFSQVVVEVMRHLEGPYALIIKSSHYPNELMACKRGSPMVLGVRELTDNKDNCSSFEENKFPSKDGKPKEYFLSNDASVIIEHSKQVRVIEDGELVHIKDGGVSVFKNEYDKGKLDISFSQASIVRRAVAFLEMEIAQLNKGPYNHYMLKEIFEQPRSITTTMRGRLIFKGSRNANSVLLGGINDHLRTLRESQRLIFIGSGSSYNAALAARPIFEKLTGIPITMEIASDLIDRKVLIDREDTAVFVSQSGEDTDTLLALQYALENCSLCVGITNTAGSALARNTHCGVHINAGAEIGVASTKAYTSQIVVMAMLSVAIASDTNSNKATIESIIDGLFDLPNKVGEVLELNEKMEDIAKLLITEKSLLVMGRGYNYATALEGSLKLKDMAHMHSHAILAGEMENDISALDDEIYLIVIATHDTCFSNQQSVIQQLHARRDRLIVICSKGDPNFVCLGNSCRTIEVPHVDDCLQSVINAVPLQLLAYHLAVLKEFNVDGPCNFTQYRTFENFHTTPKVSFHTAIITDKQRDALLKYQFGLPGEFLPFIHGVDDVRGDGNCGFRCLALWMYDDEEEWLRVRRELMDELVNNFTTYLKLFSSFNFMQKVIDALNWSAGSATQKNWMVTDIGYLIASKYNLVYLQLAKNSSYTFVPLYGNRPSKESVIAIAHVGHKESGHFIKVLLKPKFPMPAFDPQLNYMFSKSEQRDWCKRLKETELFQPSCRKARKRKRTISSGPTNCPKPSGKVYDLRNRKQSSTSTGKNGPPKGGHGRKQSLLAHLRKTPKKNNKKNSSSDQQGPSGPSFDRAQASSDSNVDDMIDKFVHQYEIRYFKSALCILLNKNINEDSSTQIKNLEEELKILRGERTKIVNELKKEVMLHIVRESKQFVDESAKVA